jgi:hypothetical protein
LIDEICSKTGNEYVVDSSKNLARFLFLQKFRPEDTYLVVLVRGIHGVASSSHFGLTDEMIFKRATNWLKLYNKQVLPVLKKVKKDQYFILRYNEFCENPEKTIMELKPFLGLQNKKHHKIIDTNEYHLVAGNPIRHSGKINIRKDNRWQSRLTQKQIELLNKKEAVLHPFFQHSSHYKQ